MPRSLRVTASIVVPRTPSFLRFEDQEMASIAIEDVSDEDLKKVGREWTKDLLERARERRNRPSE